MAKAIGAAQPFVEIALGVLLLLGLATRLAAGISALLMVLFIAGISSAWARGLAIDCGCFSQGGPAGRRPDPELLPEILRDIGFLVHGGVPAALAAQPVVDRPVDGRRAASGGRG